MTAKKSYYNSKVAYYIHGQYDLNYFKEDWAEWRNATGRRYWSWVGLLIAAGRTWLWWRDEFRSNSNQLNPASYRYWIDQIHSNFIYLAGSGLLSFILSAEGNKLIPKFISLQQPAIFSFTPA